MPKEKRSLAKKYINLTSLALGLIITFAAIIRIPLILQGFFAFTYDQGRDLFAVKEIVEHFNLTLIGPTTGLPGIFYGPWWYYYLSPIYIAARGDPKLIALSFALLGLIVIYLTYFVSQKILNNKFISITAAFIVSTSQPFLTSSSQIWSPSLIPPLMVLYILCVYKILKNNEKKWFLILGLLSGLILDSEAAYGLILITSTIIASLFYRKEFFKKSFLLYFLGILLIVFPRILFELRNDFLITKSTIKWLKSPSVFQQHLSLAQRLLNRLNIFYLIFAQTFSKGNKILATIPLSFIIFTFVSQAKMVKKIKIFHFLLLILFLLYIGFSLYPDALWEYYISGASSIFIFLILISLSIYYKKAKVITTIFIFLLLILNFEKRFIFPFKTDWAGDGAVYKNQIEPIKDIKSELKGNYSIYAYSPAGIDYPFEYLIQMYYTKGLIDKPKKDQNTIFLIIRDDSDHLYLKVGWYGDKVRDSTNLIERKEYPGNIIIEKHERIN